MSCRPFSELVYNEMGWDKSCRYKILGYRICFEGITLYVFDLLVPEIFHEGRQSSENGVGESKQTEAKAGTAKKGFYPDDIAGTFGVPVEQHTLDSEIRQMDGYVTSGMLTRQNS